MVNIQVQEIFAIFINSYTEKLKGHNTTYSVKGH